MPIEFTVPERGVQQIDMTGQGERLRALEVRTDAGIIRVNTNLVNTSTGQPVVVVEIEPNTTHGAKTEAGGEWILGFRERVPSHDVILTKVG